MATLDELSNALRNADAAGDVDAARMLASEIQKVQGAAKPDKYQTAALEDRKINDKIGLGGSPYTRRLLQGATLNTADEILAGVSTPIEMFKRGTINPLEGYRYAKAAQDLDVDKARESTGALGTAAEILGGAGTGLGLAGNGLTFARSLAPNAGLLARSAASAGDSAALGALAGAGDGNSLSERGTNAIQGGAIGGLLGGVAPGAISLGSTALSPLLSNVRARINPEGFARTQVARGVVESGMTPAQIAGDVSRAAQEGQGMFTMADAMGPAGQRMLATTARSPGQAATDVVNFLDNRQAGQGRRVVGALAEGFDSPQTAQQTAAAMTTSRDNAANAAYGAVRRDAQPVDVTNVLNHIDQQVAPFGVPHDRIAPDGITGRLLAYRRMLGGGDTNLDGSAAGGLNDFRAAQMVRQDLSDEVQTAVRAGQGNKARVLGGALRELDTALENSSNGFRQANRNFAQASRNIDAVDQGHTAAMRGRTEDIIPEFRGLTPQGQAGYRAGYVDPLIQQAQGAAFGANKARPLINDAFASESAAIAPMRTQPMMQRRIGREDTMFQTRARVTGNSKTAENMNDDAAMGVDVSLVKNVLTGNVTGALQSAMSAISNGWNGNTAGVRQEVARMLLQRGGNTNPRAIQALLDETVQRIERVAQIARQAGRGAAGGLAVAPSATGARR
jgi:hypothetical protein